MLVHFTSVPTGIVTVSGLKAKLCMTISTGAPDPPAGADAWVASGTAVAAGADIAGASGTLVAAGADWQAAARSATTDKTENSTILFFISFLLSYLYYLYLIYLV
jgi:hypothetical protein